MTQPGTRPCAVVRFSTIDVPADRRIELWEEHNADALIGLRCRTLDGQSLGATEVNVQMERLHAARVTGTSHVVERSADTVRSIPADAVVLYFTLVGEAFFYYDDGVRVLRPGQLLVCDADRPFMRGFSQGLQELALKVPRDLFAEISGRPAVTKPWVIDFADGGNAHANTLATLVGRTVHPERPVPADEQGILDLLAVAVGGRQPLPAAHLAAARAFIDRHLRDPNLSANRVANGIGLSERQLSRVFAGTGVSVPQHILRRRLELANTVLTDPAQSRRRIAEIASSCGFTSTTHFSHAYKELFGIRPADARSGAGALVTH